MFRFSLAHLSDAVLQRDLVALVSKDRATTAELLAHLAELDRRRLYRKRGFDSLCSRPVPEEVGLTSGVCAAIPLPASELEALSGRQHAPGHVESGKPLPACALAGERVPPATSPTGGSGDGATGGPFTARGRVCQLSPQRFSIQVSIARDTREKLQRVTDLLAGAVPTGDLAEVLDRALDALIAKLEQRKFGATKQPRTAKTCRSKHPRAIPNEVRRAVWKRDGGQCTYVGSGGCRCESRRRLEFDHVVPVAIGGQATVGNLRLRCRAHNQLAAEEILGAHRMKARREQAARARAAS